jgi:substrate import-associated zinc metallohydrolase lipoprotein
MFFLVGTWEYRNNGSIVLGTAEAGKKIMLSGVNELPLLFENLEKGLITEEELAEDLSHYYIKTIHHEFTHILNQTKTYPETFGTITSTTYVGDACFDTDSYWRGRGYITAYAQSEHREDFAELVSEYITHDQAWWDQQLADARAEITQVRAKDPDAEYGDVIINSKMDIVKAYLQDSWGIDIDDLRDILLRRFSDVAAGRVDLNTVEL